MLGLIRRITPKVFLNWYHFLWALVSAVRYGFPSRGMIVIGITGTNGKSTTVDVLSRILREAELKIASMSSVRFQILGKEWRNTMKMTMPGRFVVQRFLRQAKEAGCTHVVLEVTSEGMLQHRHRFINFHTAVFTNLSPEHIERHGSFENYKRTKGRLFAAAPKVHVLNGDDEYVSFFLKFSAKEKYLYSVTHQSSDKSHLQAKDVQATKTGTSFSLKGVDFSLHLLGAFQAYNALAAIAVAQSQGISLEVCKRALEQIDAVPGRMEEVISSPFRVVVDYAFTPAALEKVYKTLKPAQGSLLCVLGAAGGGRDAWKRPVLGQIAAAHCDIVLITNEDPYEEDPQQIIDQVAGGAYKQEARNKKQATKNKKQETRNKIQKVLDRREAIAKALALAQPGDTVVITGKGSEDSIAVAGGEKIPWDDREVVREEWTKLQNHAKL